MNEDAEQVARMPTDLELLVPLGQVMWAGIRLHHGVRDSINAIRGEASDQPFDLPLGPAINCLAAEVKSSVSEPERTSLLDWITDDARPACQERNGVADAVAFTAEDGKQALKGHGGRNRPTRYLAPELLSVAASLVRAEDRRPRQPYRLEDRPSEQPTENTPIDSADVPGDSFSHNRHAGGPRPRTLTS